MAVQDPSQGFTQSESFGEQWPRLEHNRIRSASLRALVVDADATLDSWAEDPTTDTSLASLLLIDSTADDVTVTLPALAASEEGRVLEFKRLDGGANDALVAPDGTDEIDGSNSTRSLASQHDTMRIVATSEGWMIL